jgi:hypothetical protein
MYGYPYEQQNGQSYGYDQQSVAYQQAYKRAARQVRQKIGFYWHLASYLIINGFLIVIYLLGSVVAEGLYYPWFIWPMMAWGVGLLFHYLSVFVFNGAYDQQKMIEAEMRRMGAVAPEAPSYTSDIK